MALLLLLGVLAAPAHTPSETFLTVIVPAGRGSLTGHWDVAERDLVVGAGLDPQRAAALDPAELDRRLQALALDVVMALELRADGQRLEVTPTDYVPIRLRDLDYIRVPFLCGTGLATRPARLDLNAAALFRVDTNIHGLLRVDHAGRTEAASFNRLEPARSFALATPAGPWGAAETFLREGITHIWLGFDHVLFLLALLLPAVLRREQGQWQAVDRFREPALHVLKLITAFTVAHSLTLSLAVLGVLDVPHRVVEPLIAASVIAAALNNLRPWFGDRSWLAAGGFGLIHGFGFAGALRDLGLTGSSLATGLISFNVGVELGQLAIVAAFLPLAFGLRHGWTYRVLTLRLGSALAATLAAVWMAERLFSFKVLPL
ncbi:MAG: apolipoprotein N-acyltransferase [Verrucomicrobiota bacterium]